MRRDGVLLEKKRESACVLKRISPWGPARQAERWGTIKCVNYTCRTLHIKLKQRNISLQKPKVELPVSVSFLWASFEYFRVENSITVHACERRGREALSAGRLVQGDNINSKAPSKNKMNITQKLSLLFLQTYSDYYSVVWICDLKLKSAAWTFFQNTIIQILYQNTITHYNVMWWLWKKLDIYWEYTFVVSLIFIKRRVFIILKSIKLFFNQTNAVLEP